MRTGVAASTYNDRASGDGPRRSPSAFTRTVRARTPSGTTTISPTRIVQWAFLTASPFTVTTPAVQRRAARERLLANRAYQSHWSRRRLDVLGEGTPLKRESSLVAWRTGDLRPSAIADRHCRLFADCEAEQQSSPRQLQQLRDILAQPAAAATLAGGCQRSPQAHPSQRGLAGRGGALQQRASPVDPGASQSCQTGATR